MLTEHGRTPKHSAIHACAPRAGTQNLVCAPTHKTPSLKLSPASKARGIQSPTSNSVTSFTSYLPALFPPPHPLSPCSHSCTFESPFVFCLVCLLFASVANASFTIHRTKGINTMRKMEWNFLGQKNDVKWCVHARAFACDRWKRKAASYFWIHTDAFLGEYRRVTHVGIYTCALNNLCPDIGP